MNRQVDLGGVTGDHRPGIKADSGEEHLHLLPGRILRFIQYDKGIAQRPAAHEGQRGNLDNTSFDEIRCLVRAKHIDQGIVERPQERIDLLGQVAGQEAELFTGLDGRPGQDDGTHPLLDQGGNGHGHGQIGLAGTGGADAEDDVVITDSVDIDLLVGGLRRDNPVSRGDIDLVEKNLVQPRLGVGLQDFQAEGDVGREDRIAGSDQLVELFEQVDGQCHIVAGAGDGQASAPDMNFDAGAVFQHQQILVEITVEDAGQFVAVQLQGASFLLHLHRAAY